MFSFILSIADCYRKKADVTAHQSLSHPINKSKNSCIYLSVQTRLLVHKRKNNQKIFFASLRQITSMIWPLFSKLIIKYIIYTWEKRICLVKKNTKDKAQHTILIFNNNNREESKNPVNLTL